MSKSPKSLSPVWLVLTVLPLCSCLQYLGRYKDVCSYKETFCSYLVAVVSVFVVYGCFIVSSLVVTNTVTLSLIKSW